LDPSRSGRAMPEGSPKVESEAFVILETAAAEPEEPEPVAPEPVEPEPEAAGVAVEVEPDMFEIKSATEEHQRQCHKVQD
jgi:hypothetical protein